MNTWLYAVQMRDLTFIKNNLYQFIRQQDYKGRTALMYASQYGFEEVVNLVVDAEHNMVDLDGQSATNYATKYQQYKILQILMNYEDSNISILQVKKNILSLQTLVELTRQNTNGNNAPIQQDALKISKYQRENKLLSGKLTDLEKELSQLLGIIRQEQTENKKKNSIIKTLKQQLQQTEEQQSLSNTSTHTDDSKFEQLQLENQALILDLKQIQNNFITFQDDNENKIINLELKITIIESNVTELTLQDQVQAQQIVHIENLLKIEKQQKEIFAQSMYQSYQKQNKKQQIEIKQLKRQINQLLTDRQNVIQEQNITPDQTAQPTPQRQILLRIILSFLAAISLFFIIL
ncbi:Ankyrin repeat-containing protein [Spironucleus salmonicida]|uniref:Ankyrin repeat-containing protein n=1 Tax=Spironucleus salmonicida TaxID=348837 RepID=V6LIR1_9EUKA|nr:Ankyrin repeat-containing protein [Spironucleus salmonicida]|eukprot:EST43611.1 Ankyrin repeat-containing protein [Spironucleus salmonicida]